MPRFDDLNPQQREAVEHTEGPLLILAGAGSGKTRVITCRIAHLIEDRGVLPESVLAVTFTNKASGEMAERVAQLVGGRMFASPWISTFHSFCVRLLRRDVEALKLPGAPGSFYTRQFAIYDEADQQALVKAAMRRLGLDDKQLTPRAVLARISWAKNHMLDPEEVYLQSSDPKAERVAHIYQVYRQELRKANALDFDDLLLVAVRLLKEAEDVRLRYQERFRYILIDEYQDTNRPQYELLRLLSGARHNVCVVGDEDQSIYSWRGADIRNILEFERDFPEARIIRLEQNYRSTQNILEAASAVVAQNVKRKGKTLWTARQGGPRLGFYEAPDGENEALFVADLISRGLQEAAAQGEEGRAAVLYRTNFQSRLFEEALRRYQLKYHVVGGFSFYERAEIKDMVSYLKFLLNPDDSVALLRIINTPARGIGKTTLETIERLALETGIPLWHAVGQAIEQKLLPQRALAALRGFRDIIEDTRALLAGAPHHGDTEARRKQETEEGRETEGTEQAESSSRASPPPEDEPRDMRFGQADISFSPEELGAPAEDYVEAVGRPAERSSAAPSTAELLKFLLDRTGYMKVLEEEATPDAHARIENLKELVNAAMDSRDRGESLAQFLDHAALVSETDDLDARASITLMSIHAAKGLEFPLVFLVGLEEGLFPHSRTLLDPDQLEEERRLCYVAMTRAMDRLILTRARYRRRYGSEMPEAGVASRFLEEIPPALLEDLGRPTRAPAARSGEGESARRTGHHYDYAYAQDDGAAADHRPSAARRGRSTAPAAYNSIDNIAEFFASRGKKFTRPKLDVPAPAGKRGLRPGARVRHPKYGEGVIYKREGEGEDAKLTVQFSRYGLKKLVEKYAQLEKL